MMKVHSAQNLSNLVAGYYIWQQSWSCGKIRYALQWNTTKLRRRGSGLGYPPTICAVCVSCQHAKHHCRIPCYMDMTHAPTETALMTPVIRSELNINSHLQGGGSAGFSTVPSVGCFVRWICILQATPEGV